MGRQGCLVGGQAPDAQVVDRHDALHGLEGFLHHVEAHISRDTWEREHGP